MTVTVRVAAKGDATPLIEWFNNGADGQIDWGSEGDFDQCVAVASEKGLDSPEGFCNLRHQDATGEPPGKGAHGGSVELIGAIADTEQCGDACECDRCNYHHTHTAAVTLSFDEQFPVPEYPPRSWFDRPEWLQPGQGLTVTDDGQVGGYFFEKGQCILDGSADCWQPPPSLTGYAAFHQQDVVTAEGETMRVGVIGQVGGHASPYVGAKTAHEHYANPDCVKMVVRAGDDEHGAWIAGAVVPGLTFRDVALVRRSALSGDWRTMGGEWWKQAGVDEVSARGIGMYDCIGPTLVNRPGLPLVRAYRQRAASAAPVYLGGVGGVRLDDEVGETKLGYTEDQARDDHGRFATDPGGAAAAELRGGGSLGGRVEMDSKGLPSKVDGIEVARDTPIAALADAKERFMRDQGLPEVDDRVMDHLTRDPWTTPEVASAFDQLSIHDQSPETAAAYDAFREESAQQWDLLTRPVEEGGAGIKVTMMDTDPYPEPGAEGFHKMMDDLRNGEMKVLKVQGEGGAQAHPLMSNDEYTRFRAVHDAFGHAAAGRGFDRHSEEAAWVAHASMYGPQADKALATETRGQNTTLGYNHEQGEYKAALLPPEYQQPNLSERLPGVMVAARRPADDRNPPPLSRVGGDRKGQHECAVAGHFPAAWKRASRAGAVQDDASNLAEGAIMADAAPPFPPKDGGDKPHDFVDDGSGKCKVCGKPEDAHGEAKEASTKVVQINVPVPAGMDAEDFAARIAAAIPEALHVVPPPTTEERLAALEARTAAAEKAATDAESRAISAELAVLDQAAAKLRSE